MLDNEKIRIYKDRIRIFLILYYFSEEYSSAENPELVRVFKSEVKVQKIDFLLRNPDYLSYELLNIARNDNSKANQIKTKISEIFGNGEPTIRRLEMERFFFGAYEDIDDVIGFLCSVGFIKFESSKSVDMKSINKSYYITQHAMSKMNELEKSASYLQWYIERCNLIKTYFGDLTGNQLKVRQYSIEEYKNTSYKEYIQDVQDNVRVEFFSMYGEELR